MSQLLRSIIPAFLVCVSTVAFAQVGDFAESVSVGDDGGLGIVEHDGGVYRIEASGNDIWGTADGFYFVYVEVEGSFRATVEAEWLDQVVPEGGPETGNEWKKMGIMARANDDGYDNPGARHAMMIARRDYQGDFQWRDTTGGESFDIGLVPAEGFTNVLRLERVGNTFIGSRQRTDGTFQLLGQTTLADMPETVAVGIVVTAHSTAEIAAAQFSNWSIEEISLGASGARAIEGDAVVDTGVDIPVTLTVTVDEGQSGDLTVTETVPQGVSVSGISEGGVYADGVITWNLANASGSTELAYTVEIPADHPGGAISFNGSIDAGSDVFGIGGTGGIVVFPETSSDLGLFTTSEDIFDSDANYGGVGAATYDPATETYRVFGSGNDIWNAADNFHFLYSEVEVQEQLTIRARVQLDPGTSTDVWAKAGAMIRDLNTPESSHVFAMIRATGRDFAPQWRSTHGAGGAWGGDPTLVYGGTDAGEQNGYVELRWIVEGNVFEFYYYDAATGERVLAMNELVNEGGTTDSPVMESPVYAGLAVTAHQVGSISVGTFTDVEIFVDEDPTLPTTVSDWALF